jgi:hypothetical protein
MSLIEKSTPITVSSDAANATVLLRMSREVKASTLAVPISPPDERIPRMVIRFDTDGRLVSLLLEYPLGKGAEMDRWVELLPACS